MSDMHDTTERERVKARSLRATRALRTIRMCNQVLVRAEAESTLLNGICTALVAKGGYRLAWVGFAENDEEKTVRPVAYAGFEERYLEKLRVSWADTERGRGPTGTAIRTSRPAVCQNMLTDPNFMPWRSEALKRGYGSSIGLPLNSEGKAFGALTIYAVEPAAFDAEEKELLAELADDLAYGIRVIRAQAERQLVAEALRREQILFNNLISTIPDHIYFKDRQSRFIRINDAQATRFGLSSPGEALGKTDFDMFSEEHARQAYEDEQRIMRTGEPLIGLEEKETWPDGHITWVSTTKVPLKDASGSITGIVGISRDITERKKAQERIREQAALLEIVPDGIMVFDLQHRILYWSKGAEQLYGWSAAEALGRQALDLLAADRAGCEAACAMALQAGSWAGEMRHRVKSGKEIATLTRLTLMRDERGRPRAILAINTDVTEKKELESRFLHAQRLESIGALASGIADDLNNVLAPIIMGAPLLRESLHDDAARHLLGMMATSAQRGADIVKQVLTFARGTEGHRVPLQLHHLLRDMAKMADETFSKSIQVVTGAAPDLWLVEADATQMHQVLMNLCINARDAMPAGGTLTLAAANVTIDASTAARTPGASAGPYVRLRITDTGTGIPVELRERIFEPFFTTKEPGKGTGLGLSTVLGIMRGHRGFIQVESEVGRGTTFALFLPAAPAAQAAVKRRSAPPMERAQGDLVLLVDDEAAVREVVRQVLEQFGYRVEICSTGAEAVAMFRAAQDKVRLVVTDIMMPEMDGPGLVQTLRALDPAVRVVGITGVADVATMTRLKALGMSALLAKPFTINQLLNTIHEALDLPAARHPPLVP